MEILLPMGICEVMFVREMPDANQETKGWYLEIQGM